MATYAIGDLQGCFTPLQRLLHQIKFNPDEDTLWFTGDLVNRGPQSLETLRFIKNLKSAKTVLGNHDLHLLAYSRGQHPGWQEDSFQSILTAPDREDLLNWLIQQPLLLHEKDFLLIHAGLAPSWDLQQAKSLAREVEFIIQGENADEFFKTMYGDEPNYWSDSLTGYDRLRVITNYLTRARFCHPDGSLELKNKGVLNSTHPLIPWFQFPNRASQNLKIIFGHWAALGGITNTENVYALDTGCVWGYCLTAMRLEDGVRFNVEC